MTSASSRFLVLLCVALAACGRPAPSGDASPPGTGGAPEPVSVVTTAAGERESAVVREAFITPASADDNIDSVATWISPEGDRWVIATAKSTDRLIVHHGDRGDERREIGRRGTAPGEFRRPNGIFVIDDLIFVVERDNRRVQALRLPDFASVGTFGEDALQKPYGLWVRRAEAGYEVFVTDAYMDPSDDDVVPPVAELDRRLQRFAVTSTDGRIEGRALGGFGATDPAGAIRIPESLWGDPVHDRLLIAEEDQQDGTRIKIYRLGDLAYSGTDLGAGLFAAQAEGIALRRCVDGGGWWVAVDQSKDRSRFLVFDRRTLAHLGSFRGERVANTDGIWLDDRPTERFPRGVLHAVDDDQAVAAFDLAEIEAALGLPACTPASDE